MIVGLNNIIIISYENLNKYSLNQIINQLSIKISCCGFIPTTNRNNFQMKHFQVGNGKEINYKRDTEIMKDLVIKIQ